MRTGMTRHAVAITLATAALWPAPMGGQSGAPPVQALYADTLAKEKAVHAAFTDQLPAGAVRKAARTVVAEYETFVRQHPKGGFSDEALWRAGNLSLETFKRLGDPEDRSAGVRLLRALAAEYPTSRLLPQAHQAMASLDGQPPAPSGAPRPVPTLRPRPGWAPGIATLSAVRRTVVAEAVRVTIELDREVPFHEERLLDPDRVFVDLSFTRVSPALTNQTFRYEGDAHPVRQIRIGRHPNDTARVVLDTAGVANCSVYPVYAPYQLVIDCVPAGQVEPAAAAPAEPTLLSSSHRSSGWARELPSSAPVSTALLGEARLPDPSPALPSALSSAVPLTSTTSTPPPLRVPARNLGGDFSIARQLGLGVSRIVIDPGHGGHDPGAKGRGITEADVVLDVALRLEKLLGDVPGVSVILTRRDDAYVPLEERTAIANREEADLFLSVHANANADGQAGGVETYFLNFATSLSAASVAARENAASGQSMRALPDFVKAIALDNKLDESREFATIVQRELVARLRPANKSLKNLGVRQAPFAVLIGAAMPSVLTEISFITNSREAQLLRGTAYRQRIAEALFEGIRKYQTALKSTGTVSRR